MRAALLLLLVVVPSAGAVACVESTSSDTATLGEGAEQALTLLEFNCTSGSMTFDISPVFGGLSLEGKLAVSTTESSLFVCRRPTTDATAGESDLVVSCNERPQSFHPGRWKVDVTKTGGAYTATLDKGDAAGAGVAFTCTTPGAGGPPPTYTEVEPIIDQTCGGCHDGAFDSLAKVKSARQSMLGMIVTGVMPRFQPTWKESSNGKLVINFLQNSPELD
jgi:hypothetical protein